MAEDKDDSDKTEEPTQRRLEDAHEKGDVAKSQEVVTFFALAGVTVIVGLAAGGSSRSLVPSLAGLIEHAADIPLDGGGLRRLLPALAGALAVAVLLPVAVMAASAVFGNLVQHRMVFSAEQMTPRLDKISPLAGFKRLFSAENLVNFVKGLIKIATLGAVMFAVLWPERDRLEALVNIDPARTLALAQAIALRMLGAMLAAMFLIAVLDYGWVRWRWIQRHKMSLQEIKDEHKQSEGDPAVKGKIRQLRQERAKNRMMAAVPTSTVVVTNPTHYAVALKYDKDMQAPVCVAKGVDEVALRIRERAREAEVPVVENPPLARALYATVEIGQLIPEQHYKAVAQVIGYVMNLKKRSAWRN